MKKIVILMLFVITSCGYQPLYKANKGVSDLKIQNVELLGDVKISKEILSSLPIVLVNNDKTLNSLNIDSDVRIIEVSKNSKGQVTSYRTTLTVKLKVLDSKNNIIDEKISQREFSYNTDQNKFKLKEYQSKIQKNLIKSIIEDIIIYLNYS
tara:strand:+ start:1057 stop:1512 length:456 start_codon:yes stop_codon:yes gene_type:complete